MSCRLMGQHQLQPAWWSLNIFLLHIPPQVIGSLVPSSLRGLARTLKHSPSVSPSSPGPAEPLAKVWSYPPIPSVKMIVSKTS